MKSEFENPSDGTRNSCKLRERSKELLSTKTTKTGFALSPTERRLMFMSNASKLGNLPLTKSPKHLEVLVAQSNPADTLLTVEAFKVAGMTSGLRCVTDGADALMYVRREGKYANEGIPDIIFLDLSQPRISGLKVLKVIKSTPELMHIPIVVAAGSDNPKFVRAVYALNGNCFIRKPGELPEFARFIEACYVFWNIVVTLPSHKPQDLDAKPLVTSSRPLGEPPGSRRGRKQHAFEERTELSR